MRHRPLSSAMEAEEVIKKSQVCYVAMTDEENRPYVIPMNFGYADGVIFLHSSRNGKKIDILKKRPEVCIAFSCDHHLRHQSPQVACSYSMKYRSVLAYGKVEFVEDHEEKRQLLDQFMKHYVDREFTYGDPAIREVCCWKVRIEKMEGRAYGY